MESNNSKPRAWWIYRPVQITYAHPFGTLGRLYGCELESDIPEDAWRTLVTEKSAYDALEAKLAIAVEALKEIDGFYRGVTLSLDTKLAQRALDKIQKD